MNNQIPKIKLCLNLSSRYSPHKNKSMIHSFSVQGVTLEGAANHECRVWGKS